MMIDGRYGFKNKLFSSFGLLLLTSALPVKDIFRKAKERTIIVK